MCKLLKKAPPLIKPARGEWTEDAMRQCARGKHAWTLSRYNARRKWVTSCPVVDELGRWRCARCGFWTYRKVALWSKPDLAALRKLKTRVLFEVAEAENRCVIRPTLAAAATE